MTNCSAINNKRYKSEGNELRESCKYPSCNKSDIVKSLRTFTSNVREQNEFLNIEFEQEEGRKTSFNYKLKIILDVVT